MAASVLEVLITGDATSLKLAFTQASAATKEYAASTASASAATKQATASTAAFGQTAQRAMTYAGLAAAAFGAISLKSAIDFNREFTLIAAVTNTATDQLGGLRDTVLQLSHETGVAPEELAHSLYFLASAGLSSAQQMDALEVSAKGAAIGLGTADDLARITANALNAFNDQGLTATQVMDTLTAAIREGTAEPDEFAQALGRVLPIADNAGISFQQVAASLATMSNAGLDVNEGVTALRAMLQSLIAPTAQTTSAFGQMGLTVTDVVASMKGEGLITTLRLVSDRAKAVTSSTGEYNQLMRHAIPNIRGLAGALNLTQQQADKVDKIFQAVSNSTGDMEKAFQTTAESDAFKVTQALNDIKIAGMNVASDVLPFLAKALEYVAKNTDILLKALLAYAGLKWVAPLLQGIAAANVELAASEELSAGAAGTSAIAGAATSARSYFAATQAANRAAMATEEVAAASTGAGTAIWALVGRLQQYVMVGGTAGEAATGVASELGGMTGAVASLGNALGASGIPQIAAFVQALVDAKNEVIAFMHGGFLAAGASALSSGTANLLSGGILGNFMKNIGGTDQQAAWQHVVDGMNAVQQTMDATAKTADQKAQIISTALQSVGGSLNPDNIDDYVNSVKGQLDQEAQQAAQADAVAAANLELKKQTQAADEATQSWQRNTAQMTEHLNGLARVGIDVNAFMSKLQDDLATSDDQAKTFQDAIDQVTQAWQDFKSKAQEALFFIPGALADVTSAAQSAQDQLAGITKDTTLSNSELAQLRDTANLTGQDILQAFQAANAQSKDFFENLKDIASVGGKAGKDLAASLLQSGNTVAANVIAHSDLEKQIIKTFGTGEDMANKFATKLTDAIVGPLNAITSILRKIAVQAFGIDLHLNDGGNSKNGVKGRLTEHELQLKRMSSTKYVAQTDADTQASKTKIAGIQNQLNHIEGGNPYDVNIGAKTDKKKVDDFAASLKALPAHMLIDIKTHVHGSDLPDEVLRKHLFDPMKQAGFKRVGDTYTLPLDVGAHTNANAPDGGGGRQGGSFGPLLKVETRQLGVLFDIRRELKGIHNISKGGGSGGSASTGGSDGGAGGSSAGNDQRRHMSNLEQQITRFVLQAGQTRGEARGLIAAIEKEGRNAQLIDRSVGQIRKELGLKSATEYRQLLKQLDTGLRGDTPLERSVHQILESVNKAGQTVGEAQGIIKRVAEEGRNPKFIGHTVKQITQELGEKAGAEYRAALKQLDIATAHNEKHRQDAMDAAVKAIQKSAKIQEQHQEEMKQFFADALAYATHNVPRLPKGHTHIDPNEHERRRHHRRPVTLNMDRRRFTDAASYDVDYARGF